MAVQAAESASWLPPCGLKLDRAARGAVRAPMHGSVGRRELCRKRRSVDGEWQSGVLLIDEAEVINLRAAVLCPVQSGHSQIGNDDIHQSRDRDADDSRGQIEGRSFIKRVFWRTNVWMRN